MTEHDDTPGVTAHLAELNPALKPVVEALRAAVLAADPRITEGIKWNSASFYCRGWFATINTRAKGGVLVVLHLGVKTRADADATDAIEDPAGLLRWLSPDRAVVTFAGADDVAGKRKPFEAVIRRWVEYLIRQDEATRLPPK